MSSVAKGFNCFVDWAAMRDKLLPLFFQDEECIGPVGDVDRAKLEETWAGRYSAGIEPFLASGTSLAEVMAAVHEIQKESAAV